VASEENDDIVHFDNGGKYVVTMDPLDGSSNIDVNVSIGTIFSIYRRMSTGDKATMDDFMQPGQRTGGRRLHHLRQQHHARVHHGPRCQRLHARPQHRHVLPEPPDMQTPAEGKIYSVNEGNYFEFSDGVRNYIDDCKRQKMSAVTSAAWWPTSTATC
jgi:fructose-1,6-bisphosphatase I